MSPQPNKKRCGPPPTRESFHLHMARSAFLADERPIDEALVDFEAAVAHVLAGGYLTQQGRIPVVSEEMKRLTRAVRDLHRKIREDAVSVEQLRKAVG